MGPLRRQSVRVKVTCLRTQQSHPARIPLCAWRDSSAGRASCLQQLLITDNTAPLMLITQPGSHTVAAYMLVTH